MRLSRIIMALTVGLAVAAVPTVAGAAQPQPAPPTTSPDPTQPPPYPPGLATLTVTPTTITLGGTVNLHGSGWTPGELVIIRVEVTPLAAAAPERARRSSGETVAFAPVSFQRAAPVLEDTLEVHARADGTFDLPYKPKRTGHYTFIAEGQTSRKTATAVLKVIKKQPPLPVTGSSLSTPLKIGGGLVGAGAVMVLMTLAWRRRHSFGGGSAH